MPRATCRADAIQEAGSGRDGRVRLTDHEWPGRRALDGVDNRAGRSEADHGADSFSWTRADYSVPDFGRARSNVGVSVWRRIGYWSCSGSAGKEKWRILPVGEVHDQHATCQRGHRRNAPCGRVASTAELVGTSGLQEVKLFVVSDTLFILTAHGLRTSQPGAACLPHTARGIMWMPGASCRTGRAFVISGGVTRLTRTRSSRARSPPICPWSSRRSSSW